MKSKHIYYASLIIVVIGALAICGTVIAYMFKQTGIRDNKFTPAEVACEVAESFDGENKTAIAVKNTGTIKAYLRVRLVTYWVDGSGNVISKTAAMPTFTVADGWILGQNDTYYYKSAVLPNITTPSLLASPITLQKDANGNLQVVEVFAEAIQSEPTKAVTNSWGVTLDASGNITN